DAETGIISTIDNYEYDCDRTTLTLSFAPCESYIISISPVPIDSNVITIDDQPQFKKVIELDSEWDFYTEKFNALPLNEWKYSTFVSGGGEWYAQVHSYKTDFYIEAELDSAKILIDGLLNETVWWKSTKIHVEVILNGNPITEFVDGTYLDHQMKEAEIASFLKRGKNTLEIKTASNLYPAGNLQEPVYILGNFELRKQGSKTVAVLPSGKISTGDWAEQGYPYYSGIGVYSQKINIPKTSKSVYLRMEKPGDLAEVIVNGEFASVMLWDPWITDITDLCKSGENEITIKVANSMANVLLMDTNPSGILGKVEICLEK
ncbi:MAG: glycosylhydrolase-like jelly roll fold domain-containing protein, partial [Armatimonadota bacterium]